MSDREVDVCVHTKRIVGRGRPLPLEEEGGDIPSFLPSPIRSLRLISKAEWMDPEEDHLFDVWLMISQPCFEWRESMRVAR